MPISSILSWKDFFLSNKSLDSSNEHLIKIKAAVGPLIPFITSFNEISKNQGISFLSLDPSETQPQLFHHGTIIGGSWSSPSKHLVSILGFDNSAKPIQIVQKSIKDVKHKSFSAEEFAAGLDSHDKFENFKNPRPTYTIKILSPS
jgi:hypothetical protein